MDFTRRYNIPFKGLAEGKHDFEFDIDDRFFQEFDTPGIKGGKVLVHVVLNKSRAMLELSFDISGEVRAECDRCLSDCMLAVRYESNLVVRFSESEREGDPDMIWLSPAESELNLAQYIYESIILSLPYQRVHPEGKDGRPTCDPDMLSRFRIVSGEEFDSMAPQGEQTLEDNPQWEKLRDLKDKL